MTNIRGAKRSDAESVVRGATNSEDRYFLALAYVGRAFATGAADITKAIGVAAILPHGGNRRAYQKRAVANALADVVQAIETWRRIVGEEYGDQ